MSELSKKADLALADLAANGGLLNPEQGNRFIQTAMDTPTLLGIARTVPMSGPTMNLNKIGFGDRILRAASQTAGSRALSAADRAKPTTGQVHLQTKEVIAELRLPYEVIEDNIEKGGIEGTLIDLIARRSAVDLEELVVKGDTALAGTDAYLGLMDGVLKKASVHVVDNAAAALDTSTFGKGLKALPAKYRRNLGALRWLAPNDKVVDYKVKLSERGSNLGDAILTGGINVPVLGVGMVEVSTMPNDKAILTDPQNIVIGIQRAIRIETDRDITSREVIIVVTARIAVAVDETDALVQIKNFS